MRFVFLVALMLVILAVAAVLQHRLRRRGAVRAPDEADLDHAIEEADRSLLRVDAIRTSRRRRRAADAADIRAADEYFSDLSKE